ncbi:MAG: TonB family protein [Mariprofundaceae bacterium]
MNSNSTLLRITAIGVSAGLHMLLFLQVGGSVANVPAENKISQKVITRVHLTASSSSSRTEISKAKLAKTADMPPKPVRHTSRKHLFPKTVMRSHQSSPKPQKVEREREKKSQASITQTAVAPAYTKQMAIDKGMVHQLRQQYLARVIAQIERHKYYPSTARRRRIQGNVHISFMLFQNGSIGAVKTHGDASILRKAARQAVFKAQPMPRPPVAIQCPIHCVFSMRYALK